MYGIRFSFVKIQRMKLSVLPNLQFRQNGGVNKNSGKSVTFDIHDKGGFLEVS